MTLSRISFGVKEFDCRRLHDGANGQNRQTCDNHPKTEILRNSKAIESERIVVSQKLHRETCDAIENKHQSESRAGTGEQFSVVVVFFRVLGTFPEEKQNDADYHAVEGFVDLCRVNRQMPIWPGIDHLLLFGGQLVIRF